MQDNMLVNGVLVMFMFEPVWLFNVQFYITRPNSIMYPDFGIAEVGAGIRIALPAVDKSEAPAVFQFKPDGLKKRKLPDEL